MSDRRIKIYQNHPPTANVGECYEYWLIEEGLHVKYFKAQGDPIFVWQKDIYDTAASVPVVTTLTTGADALNKSYILPAGQYKLSLSFHINVDATTSDSIVTATFDGVNLSAVKDEIYRLEAKDSSSGGGNIPGGGSGQIDNYSHDFILNVATSGAKNLTVRIETEAGGVDALIWDISVVFKRIA